jgi:hypothetical protein
MRECVKDCWLKKQCCDEKECRMHLEYPEDLNCTLVAIAKYGPMTLEEVGLRHHISTVRVKQIADSALVKLKKTLDKENTI